LPARTDTRWFHDYCYANGRVTLKFLKGRLKFGDGTQPAPFPSMLVVFRG
jgi:site-specific DNA-methyltransferase (adenine-specific)